MLHAQENVPHTNYANLIHFSCSGGLIVWHSLAVQRNPIVAYCQSCQNHITNF